MTYPQNPTHLKNPQTPKLPSLHLRHQLPTKLQPHRDQEHNRHNRRERAEDNEPHIRLRGVRRLVLVGGCRGDDHGPDGRGEDGGEDVDEEPDGYGPAEFGQADYFGCCWD